MKKITKFLILIVTLMSYSFLHSQETLEEIVTFIVPYDSIHFEGAIYPDIPAADINNDNYSDFITGYFQPTNDIFQLHFYYGCPSPDSSPDIIVDLPIDDYGIAGVSYTGDLNSDGWKDLVVTINYYYYRSCYIFWGEDNLLPDFTSPGYYFDSYSYQSNMNWNAGNLGSDFNGDGFDDLIVTASGPDMLYYGMVDIFYGSNDLDLDPDFHIIGQENDFLCAYMAIGDLNGDGFDDLICSRMPDGNILNLTFEIYLGSENMDTIVDHVIDWVPGRYYVHPYANGDINNDGFNDLFVFNKIFLGGPVFDTNCDFMLENGHDTSIYCDINNDGIDDILAFDDLNNTAYFYYGGTDFDEFPDEIINGNEIDASFSRWTCNMFDFNGDDNNEFLMRNNEYDNMATLYTSENLVNFSQNTLSPVEINLSNYPNPFNPTTTISYNLPIDFSNPVIEIFNIRGERIRILNCQNQIPIVWDGTDNNQNQVSSGIYLYQIKSDEGVLLSKKMLLLK